MHRDCKKTSSSTSVTNPLSPVQPKRTTMADVPRSTSDRGGSSRKTSSIVSSTGSAFTPTSSSSSSRGSMYREWRQPSACKAGSSPVSSYMGSAAPKRCRSGSLEDEGSDRHPKSVVPRRKKSYGVSDSCESGGEQFVVIPPCPLPAKIWVAYKNYMDNVDRCVKIPRRQGQSGPSSYISEKQMIPVDTDDDEAHNLFVDAFLHNNRLEHMIQVMGYHPAYLEAFLKTQQYMLRGDGPLSYDYRHYIAIMAAARHQCSYLVDIQTTEFLLQGGDERWLKGLEYVPQKLRDLYEINKILAHRPWLINKTHIEKLTRGNDNWSLSEVMHALVLLAHFHSLGSFVYGCGINAEIDHEGAHTFRPPSTDGSVNNSRQSPNNSHQGTPNSTTDVEGGIEALLQRMKKLTEEAPEEMSPEELQKRFEKVESQSAELPAATTKPTPKADIMRYVEDGDFVYQDFAKRGTPSEIPTFRAQDYSWEEQGYSLANRLYAEIGTLMDDKFKVAYNLTYYTMGDTKDVDTSSFRRAVWHYIHCMFGIRHDDYDYSEVNQLLERSLKAYVKTVTCYPERITRKDYDSFMREFKHSEKVHVNLMLLEARMQAELLYALRAIMRYMT